MKKEAAAVKIQKHIRRYDARTAYKRLHVSTLVLQTGLRTMAARKEFRFRKKTKAAIIIQVISLAMLYCLDDFNFYSPFAYFGLSVPSIFLGIIRRIIIRCRPGGVVIKLLHTIKGSREDR